VLLLLLQVALQLEKVVVADRPHGHVRDGAGRRSRHLGDHQLLVRKESRVGTAGNGQEAAPVPLVLAALFLLETFQALFPGILL
jgi:hypothetical protein